MKTSTFTRIPVDHPLTRAAREVNSAEFRSIDKTLADLEMNVTASELFYLAEQRALRALAAQAGYNLGAGDPAQDQKALAEISERATLNDAGFVTLLSAYVDGFTIGYRAAQLAEADRATGKPSDA